MQLLLAEAVEFSQVGTAEKGVPLIRRETEYGSLRISAVTEADAAIR